MKKNALLERLKSRKQYCTGCGCCENICGQNAISMDEDSLGFLRPAVQEKRCIDCMRCVKACPVLSERKGAGSENPECLAVCAENSIRAQSSSGGVFSCLAEYVLSQGGCVFGAAMGENFTVSHCCVESLGLLPKLRKSKYVQSRMGLTYRSVKEKLSNGKLVLFTGTPCQTAALNAYLGTHPDNLITADILCHGVPSGKMLRDYLAETQPGTIENIDFRPSEQGWKRSPLILKVTDVDGSSCFYGKSQSTYEQGFHTDLTLQKSCVNCKFAEIPRQSDISMGDFWGIGDKKKELDDDLGTSVVLLNTQWGTEIFSKAMERRQSRCLLQRTPVQWMDFNRIHAERPENPARKYFEFLYPRIGFECAVKEAAIYKAPIGIVGPWMNRNCGGALTYYGLYETLMDMGHHPIMISQPEGLEWGPDAGTCRYLELPYPDYAIAPIQRDYAAQRKFAESFDTFLVGSDQLFTGTMLDLLDGYADLQWVSDEKKKIAYAASFAYDEFEGTAARKRSLCYFLEKFDAFSVREKSGVDLAKREFDLDAEWVVDPVFLCPKEKWNMLADRGMARVPQEPTVFGYILDPNKEKEVLMHQIAQKVGGRCLAASAPENEPNTVKQMWDIETLSEFANEEMLAQIRASKFVLTDSFHGMCFAVIFQKPFAVVLNNQRGKSRFESFLGLLGAENRTVKNPDDLREELFVPLGMEGENRLRAACASSREWLKTALEMPKKKKVQNLDYEMACNYSDRSIQMLQKRIKFMEDCLNGRIDWLIGKVDNELAVTDEKQWRQLEDHRSRLDGIEAAFNGPGGLLETDEKQWRQLEDHRSRLDGIDAKLNGRKRFFGRDKK